jgi:putative aldouronate transport system substrate-binding protein
MLRSISIPGDEMAITKQCEKTDVAMKWLDFVFAGEEAFTLEQLGVEGLTYKVENGEKVKIFSDPEKSFTDRLTEIGAGQPPFCHRQSAESWFSNYPDWVAEADERQKPYYKDPLIVLPLTKEEQEIKNTYWTDAMTYVNEMTAKFINGQEPLENFDSYVNSLNKMNIDELTNIYQQMYDRYIKIMGK